MKTKNDNYNLAIRLQEQQEESWWYYRTDYRNRDDDMDVIEGIELTKEEAIAKIHKSIDEGLE